MIIYEDEPYKLRNDTSHDMSITVTPYTVVDIPDHKNSNSTFQPSHLLNDKMEPPNPSNLAPQKVSWFTHMYVATYSQLALVSSYIEQDLLHNEYNFNELLMCLKHTNTMLNQIINFHVRTFRVKLMPNSNIQLNML